MRKPFRKIRRLVRKFMRTYKHGSLFEAFRRTGSWFAWRLVYRRRVAAEKRHPLPVNPRKLVFESFGNYDDNARVLSDYLIQEGYADKYEIVWIVNDPKKYQSVIPSCVRVVKKRYANRKATLEAHREVHSAAYVFYSHSMRWVNYVHNNQVYVDLWHGCSFKQAKGGGRIFFDYCLVAGDLFVKTKADFFQCDEKKLLPIGYPRYDLMKTGNAVAADYVKEIRNKHGADKLILWMPTYRKTKRSRLNENTLDQSKWDLPIVYDEEHMRDLNDVCGKFGVLLMIKWHMFSDEHVRHASRYGNIMFVGNEELEKRDVQLYALLHEADALITDYSSVGVDFLLLNRQIGYTLDDYEKYMESRGFTIENPLDYMPGKRIYMFEDMKEFIREVSEGIDVYEADRKKVTAELLAQCESYCQKTIDTLGIQR